MLPRRSWSFSWSFSSGGNEVSLLLLAISPDQGFVKAVLLLWLGKFGREAKAFIIVCRGIQSVESAFWGRPEIDFWRNRRKAEEGSDQPLASSWVESSFCVVSTALPVARGAGS